MTLLTVMEAFWVTSVMSDCHGAAGALASVDHLKIMACYEPRLPTCLVKIVMKLLFSLIG